MLIPESAGSTHDRPAPAAPGARTLADAHAGDTVRVCAIAPDVRDLLAGFGLYDGASVRCTSATHYVVVCTSEGMVPLERGLAARVGVADDAEPAGRPGAADGRG